MAFDLANFPSDLERGFGTIPAKRDATRLLLSFKQSHSRQEIEELLKNTRLVLEDSSDETSMLTRVFRYFSNFFGGETSRQWEKVQQTPRKFWIRSRIGNPITQEDISALERLLGPTLNWIGPVYRSPGSVGRKGLFCPFPTVLLIKPVANVREKALLQKLDELNLKEIPEKSQYRGAHRYFIIKDPSQHTVYPLLADLRRESGLIQDAHLERMYLLSAAASIPSDPLYLSKQWNMTQISAPLAWDISTGNSPVVVCVLDTGCDLDHPDLTGSYTSPHTILNEDGSNPSIGGRQGGLTDYCDSHGTRCAGVVAAGNDNGKGVAGLAGNHCQIMPVAFPYEAAGMIAEGIRYAAEYGAHVISLSYADDNWMSTPEDKEAIDNAIEYACQPDPDHNRPGVLICVCTQNEGVSHIQYPATLNDPNHAWVMACGASDPSDQRCTFSNYGNEMSVVAPGVDIPTTTNHHSLMNNWSGCEDGDEGDLDDGSGQLDYYSKFAGTSASTPHVAGLAALLLSTFPNLRNSQVRDIIEGTADYIRPQNPLGITSSVRIDPTTGNEVWNEETGYGRINASQALRRPELDFADVMIRDYLGDTGAEPSSPPGGDFWSSSDIVIRPTDDGVFIPDDPTQSSVVKRGGLTNYLYVRVSNNGLQEARNVTVTARIAAYVGLGFAYPSDWLAKDANHVAPTPITTWFANVPVGGTVLAKFSISREQVEGLWGWISGMGWHPCLLAEVTADNDYALNSPALTGGSPAVLRNNLAQRNLSVVDVSPGARVELPFIVGNAVRAERAIELLIELGLLPIGMPSLSGGIPPLPVPGGTPPMLSLDVSREAFPRLSSTMREARDRPGIAIASIEGGRVVLQDNKRFVEITGEKAVIRMEKEPQRLYALAMQTVIPHDAIKGQRYTLKVSQRNQNGKTIGGTTVVYVVA